MRTPTVTETSLIVFEWRTSSAGIGPGNIVAPLGSFGALLLWVTIMMVCIVKPASAEPLSPEELRGKQIYLTGSGSSGHEMTAYVGYGSIPMPASGLPCGACHGPDGLGRPEGGVVPSNITWSRLTKSYGTVTATGIRHPAYTADTLARAITTGIDPSGNRLDISMPRYRMETEDIEALIAYLKLIESELDPGLTDDRIVLGTIVPSAGPLRSLGRAMQRVMEVYFGDINTQGGIYGRTLHLKVMEADNRTALLEKGKELIEGGEVFALVGAFTAGVDNEYAKLVEQNEVPMVGPFTQFNQEDNSLRRFTFYLLGGVSVQARALVDYASRKLGGRKPRTVVVYPPGPLWAAVAKAIETQGGRHEWPAPMRIQYMSGRRDAGKLARRLKEARIDAVFFFGGTKELLALAGEAERLAWAPYLFLSGSLAGKEIFEVPSLFQDKIFLAYAMTPADHTRAGVREFSAMQRRHGLSKKHLLAQIVSYSATKVLVEGLKRAGRSLSREKLIGVLEKMYQYETGLTPKLTYSQNRRIGALGAHIVAIDLEKRKFAAGSEWIKLDLQ